ncbi:hypothetical protein BH10PSE17_BH10PSE17_17650 [soil metagenome]
MALKFPTSALCAVACSITLCAGQPCRASDLAPSPPVPIAIPLPPLAPAEAYQKGVEAYVAKDFTEARAQWSTVVADDTADADNNLGYLLYYGLGGPRDYRRAVQLWRRAAMAGQPESQMHMGDAFQDGKALAKDPVQAYAWLRLSMATAADPQSDRADLFASIHQQAKDALAKLAAPMSRADIAKGERLGAQYIVAFVPARLVPTAPMTLRRPQPPR